jgi:hypothetical protein
MSGAMDSSTEPQTIFVELLDEGTVCLRPTQGVPLGDGRYRLLPTANYDPEDEHWQFPPGCVVRCRTEAWSGKEVLVARERVDQG